tara:strand:- start:209 stop:502 length:294 start_codon:yes stop_codon:yes gene_type:complete
MKVKLKLDLADGKAERELTTNLFVICEWEKTENRRVSDGKGIGYSDLVCWAYNLVKLAGDKVPKTWREWLEQNPDMQVTAVDQTDPNPTGLELTEGN